MSSTSGRTNFGRNRSIEQQSIKNGLSQGLAEGCGCMRRQARQYRSESDGAGRIDVSVQQSPISDEIPVTCGYWP